MSFVGSYSHSMDAKKRVFIPSKFRDDLGEEFYITRKFDAYLSIYTAEDWKHTWTKSLSSLKPMQKNSRISSLVQRKSVPLMQADVS